MKVNVLKQIANTIMVYDVLLLYTTELRHIALMYNVVLRVCINTLKQFFRAHNTRELVSLLLFITYFARSTCESWKQYGNSCFTCLYSPPSLIPPCQVDKFAHVLTIHHNSESKWPCWLQLLTFTIHSKKKRI